MRHLLKVLTCSVLLVVAMATTGCDPVPMDGAGQKVYSSGKEYVDHREFEYIVVDGHEYLSMLWGTSVGGITHSPNCPCLGGKGGNNKKGKMEKNKEDVTWL